MNLIANLYTRGRSIKFLKMNISSLDSSLQAHSKLEKETSNSVLLKERVEKYHDLSTQMSEILKVFEQRLGKLEQSILPVYQETEQLQKRQQNLEATLNCLETVLAHYDVSQDVCNLVHQGPNEGNVGVFLEALGRLRSAMEYFLHHNSQSVELENVTSLFNTGCESLNNHYRMLLKKNGSALKPVELLDLIYIEDDSSSDEFTSFRQLSQSTREELFTISHWLEQNLRFEYTMIYSTERGEVVLRSLQHLKDHQKSNSWGNEALVLKSTVFKTINNKKKNKMEECRTPTLQCCHEFKFDNSPFNSCLQEAQIFNRMWCSTPKDTSMSTYELQTSMISPLEGLNKSTFSLSPKFSPVASTSNNLSPEYASHHSLIKSILNSNITVHLLLKYGGLEAYADYFEKCGIDINDFMKLKRHDLQKLGIMAEVDCDRIEKFLADLNFSGQEET
uniref:SAM domain-containing protein n=1 Tax=Glossina pallidipes TaxID=7398 RepID=A0A1A9ZRX5_GLOPL